MAHEEVDEHPIFEFGPSHDVVTLDDLPPPETNHWLPRHKAQVLGAIETGLLTVDEAFRRYRLSIEEFGGWQRNARRFGVRGLRATKLGELGGKARRRVVPLRED